MCRLKQADQKSVSAASKLMENGAFPLVTGKMSTNLFHFSNQFGMSTHPSDK